MNSIDVLSNQLRERGFRMTPQRLAILQVLSEADGHLSPTQVYDRVQIRVPGITEPTVYRTLSFLAAEDVIMAAHVGSGQLVFEFTEHRHHHVICRTCHGAIEVPHELLEDVYQKIHQDTGFAIGTSHMTFFGLCPSCQD